MFYGTENRSNQLSKKDEREGSPIRKKSGLPQQFLHMDLQVNQIISPSTKKVIDKIYKYTNEVEYGS